jgi:hypothetical protein
MVLRKWVPCHTCYLDLCPYDNLCINLIEVSEVVECVRQSNRMASLPFPSPTFNNQRGSHGRLNPEHFTGGWP